jgi:ABC-type transporter Mla MlaB component
MHNATGDEPCVRFRIRPPLARGDLPGLCRRVCALLQRSPGVAVAYADVSGIGADAVAVDALARLQLAARSHHCRVVLRHSSEELRDLVAFMGLEDVLSA